MWSLTARTCRLNMKHRQVHTFDASTINALKFIWNCENIGISCIVATRPTEKLRNVNAIDAETVWCRRLWMPFVSFWKSRTRICDYIVDSIEFGCLLSLQRLSFGWQPQGYEMQTGELSMQTGEKNVEQFVWFYLFQSDFSFVVVAVNFSFSFFFFFCFALFSFTAQNK